MPKYYIKSGNLRLIIDAESEDHAIIKALQRSRKKGIMLGHKICIDEKGFSCTQKQCFDITNFKKI